MHIVEPPWLQVMRSLEGTQFQRGGIGDRDKIHDWLDYIADRHPETASYCAFLKSEPYFPWCGVTVAYCMAKVGIRPVFNAGDYHRFAFATAWEEWGGHAGSPEPGDVVIFNGDGLEHVTLFVSEADERHWNCFGGNQGGKVQQRPFPKAAVAAVRRPPAPDVATQDQDPPPHSAAPPHEAWDPGPGPQAPPGVPGLPPEFILLAQASQRKWGVPASVTLAQTLVESSGGKNMPAHSFNPFGITTNDPSQGVLSATQEVINGKRIGTRRYFRVFASFAEAFDYHGELLAKHYPEAMRFKDDPLQFVQNLKRYATAPEYARALRDRILTHNLRQFDGGSEEEPSQMDGTILSMGSTGALVGALQQQLCDLGYWTGGIDNEFGTLTQSALLSFQAENNLATDGVAGSDVFEALKQARPRSLLKKRADATPDDLAAWGSRTVLNSNNTKFTGLLSGILGVLGLFNSIAVNFGKGGNPAGGDLIGSLNKGIGALKTLSEQKTVTADQIRSTVNDLTPLVDPIKKLIEHPAQPLNSIVDFAANNPKLVETFGDVLPLLSTVVGSLVPGFGGSLLAVAFGVAAHYFGTQINRARTEDHNNAANIKPLPKQNKR